MGTQRIQGYPVLIIGAGRGGHALLEMFLADNLVTVVAMADTNPDAPGIRLAKKHGISTFGDAVQALHACKDYPDCIVYNLSHNDRISAEAEKVFGDKRVASGPEVKLFWQMVTNLKQVKGELEQSQNQLQAIIQNAMDGIITIGERGEIQGFNPAAEQIFGYAQEEIMGENVKILMPEPDKGAHDGYLERHLRKGQEWGLDVSRREVMAMRKNGVQFPMELSLSEMSLSGQRYFCGIVRDITERKLAEQKIVHLAHHDFLTGLPNRAQFMSCVGQSIRLAKRNKHRAAVMFLDLDGFKQVNDTLGHEAGDLLLQEVSKRLKLSIRASDTVARVGGDEFTFVLNNIESSGNAETVARKIIAALAAPFELGGRQCHVGGSIGVAMFPDDSEEAESLIKQADGAMYLAKQSGKNTYKFYKEKLRGLNSGDALLAV